MLVKTRVVLLYSLVLFLTLALTGGGPAIAQVAKSWYLDRMVLLFEDMKQRNATYASWEYGS